MGHLLWLCFVINFPLSFQGKAAGSSGDQAEPSEDQAAEGTGTAENAS